MDRIGQPKTVQAINFVFEDSVEFRVREVLEQKLSVIFDEFGIDKTGDVLDSAQAEQGEDGDGDQHFEQGETARRLFHWRTPTKPSSDSSARSCTLLVSRLLGMLATHRVTRRKPGSLVVTVSL